MAEDKKDKNPPKLPSKAGLPELEKETLSFWNKKKIFLKSLKQTAKNKKFVFYEGPPSANGRPGLHHVLARSFKDIICRYKTMQGFNVPRQAGWDTHGLPVEIQVEKSLGLKSKKDIENLVPGNKRESIIFFNQKCRESVWQYRDLWENLTNRMGYWLEMENPYITYDSKYIESLWWIFKKISDKGLLYQGHKVIPWCPRCGTGLSSHEIAQGYKTVTENSVYIKFKLLPKQKIDKFSTDEKTYILSWTTTPWTLPGNVALAIGEKIKYIAVRTPKKELLILAKNLWNKNLFEGKIEKEFSGKELLSLKYKPFFNIKELISSSSYQIYPADFITTEDGTGIVHTAVMYGEDDYQLGTKFNLPAIHTVSEDGKFKSIVPEFSGLPVKNTDTENKIISYLKKNNFLLKTVPYKHEYPFCWRCDSPILYFARSSWFIKMSSLRKELQKNNEKINWVPAHIKEGRFGEWLKETKDWAISRERYWATPLPIWQCKKGHLSIISSLEELDEKSFFSGNEFIIMRHGEAESNVKKILSSSPENNHHLTEKGKKEVLFAAKKLKKENIDIIISSDILRAKETAAIIKKELKINEVIFDSRLREINFGEWNNQSNNLYEKISKTKYEHFSESAPQGETLRQVKERVITALKDINNRYKNKKILIIGHGDPLFVMAGAALGLSDKEISLEKKYDLKTAEFKKISLKNYPLSDAGNLDLHRPFIDEIFLKCAKCGEKMERVKELADVWFDSGAMPFAAINYPFENRPLIEKNKFFPADYISEGIDQTRGWFYTLLAVSTIIKNSTPFKNVICLGLIHDKNGQKMSKSRGNIIDPWEMMDKYGADSLRWYLYTLNDPGDAKNFNEEDLKKISQNVFGILKNCLIYWLTYGTKNIKSSARLSHPLDLWLSSRQNQTISEVTSFLEKYDIIHAGKSIESFINDLSRWYIRRSRGRFQNPENKSDTSSASKILFEALLALSKLIAPFAPFFSEFLYQSLAKHSKSKFKESIHLENWLKTAGKSDNKKLLENMETIRRLASLALAERETAGIKIRQPLKELKIEKINISPVLLEILKDEVNVKSITFTSKLPKEKEVELDINITPELKKEGAIRELIRAIQSLRGKSNLKPGQIINLCLENYSPEAKTLLEEKWPEISRACSLKKLLFNSTSSSLTKEQISLPDLGNLTLSLK